MTLWDKLSDLIAADTDDARFEAISHLTPYQKDIVIAEMFKTLKEMPPEAREIVERELQKTL